MKAVSEAALAIFFDFFSGSSATMALPPLGWQAQQLEANSALARRHRRRGGPGGSCRAAAGAGRGRRQLCGGEPAVDELAAEPAQAHDADRRPARRSPSATRCGPCISLPTMMPAARSTSTALARIILYLIGAIRTPLKKCSQSNTPKRIVGNTKMNARIETWRAVTTRFFLPKITATRKKRNAPITRPMGMWVSGRVQGVGEAEFREQRVQGIDHGAPPSWCEPGTRTYRRRSANGRSLMIHRTVAERLSKQGFPCDGDGTFYLRTRSILLAATSCRSRRRWGDSAARRP